MISSVNHTPSGDWAFDDSVAGVFPDMLRRSIPDIDGLRRTTLEVVVDSIAGKSYPRVLDVGSSLGGATSGIINAHPTVTVHGVDNSAAMVDRVAPFLMDRASAVLRDVEDEGIPDGPWDAILWSLTLQFVAPALRPSLLRQCRESLSGDGVMFVAEKTLGPDPEADAFLVRTYHARKAAAGYSTKSIEAKSRALRRSLMPMSCEDHERAFRAAGFKPCRVWQHLSFAAWRLT